MHIGIAHFHRVSRKMTIGARSPRTYIVSDPEAGRRIIPLLRRLLPGVPSSRIFRALRTAEVRVNSAKVTADYQVVAGDRIFVPALVVAEPEAPSGFAGAAGGRRRDSAAPKPFPRPHRVRGIRVLYEDADFVVIFKPAGLPVHGGSGITGPTLAGWARERFAVPDSTYQPSPVHRIDRPASGLVVFAKTLLAHQHLARIFAEKSTAVSPEKTVPVEKVYLALVRGKPPGLRGTIELPVGLKRVFSGRGPARLAVSDYRVLAQNPPVCLLELRPVHGRTHQLRLHLSHSGIPILGDRRYGGEFPGIYRPLLHLWRLKFPLPAGKPMAFVADPPADFIKATARFGLPLPGSTPPTASTPRKPPRDRRKHPAR